MTRSDFCRPPQPVKVMIDSGDEQSHHAVVNFLNSIKHPCMERVTVNGNLKCLSCSVLMILTLIMSTRDTLTQRQKNLKVAESSWNDRAVTQSLQLVAVLPHVSWTRRPGCYSMYSVPPLRPHKGYCEANIADVLICKKNKKKNKILS